MKKALLICTVLCAISICAFAGTLEVYQATTGTNESFPVTQEAVPVLVSDPFGATGYVLLIIPQYNFVESEYSITKVAISRAGFTVEVASASTRELALGADSLKVRPNLSIDQINTDKYDAVIFVGGYMSKKFFEDKILIAKAKEFNDKGKLIGAMDNTPYFMAQWGILKDTKVTVNRSLVRAMKSMNMNYVDKDIVIDKNFISVNDLLYSDPFATEFINELKTRTSK